MKIVSLVLALSFVLGGCATRRGAKTTMVVGGVVAGLGIGAGAIAYEKSGPREPELGAFVFGGPPVALGSALVVGALLNLIWLDATGAPEPERARPAPVAPAARMFACRFLEIQASRGAAPAVDHDLAALRPQLTRGLDASWNQLRVQTATEHRLAEGRATQLPFALGGASVTATAIAPTRFTFAVTIDDASGQHHIYPQATVAGGEYAVSGPIVVGERLHTLALACR